MSAATRFAIGRFLTSAKVQIKVETNKNRRCTEADVVLNALTDFFLTNHRRCLDIVLRLFNIS